MRARGLGASNPPAHDTSPPTDTLPPAPHPQQPEHIAKGYCPRLANARLPGSYINHYCANGGVVVPQFGYHTDKLAIEALQKAYGPSYKVRGAQRRGRGLACWCTRRVGVRSRRPARLLCAATPGMPL